MPEPDYTNRELDRMFKDIMDTLYRIEEQTTKTNGRVTRLEFWKEGFTAKIAGIVGKISIVWLLLKQFILKTV
jgi:hypothetical protein